MKIQNLRYARQGAVVCLAACLSVVSIGCKISGAQVGGGVGIGTNGRVTGTIGGTITFRPSTNNTAEVINEDTGQVYTDDGTLDYSQVVGTQGDTLGGSVYNAGGDGGGSGGGCGGHFCQEEIIQ